MVKNLKGGKHKNIARKYNNDIMEKKFNVRLKEDDMEHYAFVEKILGNGHFDALCDDNVLRRCRIPGKFKKRRRDNLVVVHGLVLIGKYDFETAAKDKMEKGDLMETYSEFDKNFIVEQSKNDEQLSQFFAKNDNGFNKLSSGQVSDVVFADEDVIAITKVVVAAEKALMESVEKATFDDEEEIDIDDI